MSVPKIAMGEYEAAREGNVVKYSLENITTQEGMDEALEHMVTHFLPREPLSKYLGLCSDGPSKSRIEQLWALALKQGLGIGAYLLSSNGSKGKLIGINITGVSQRDAPHDEQCEGKCRIIFKTFNSMMERADVYGRYAVDEYLEAFGLSVHPDYHGYNLGYKILESREKLCRSLGLKATATMFTAASSQHIAKKLGYDTLVEIDYDKLSVDGNYPFRGMWETLKEKKCTVLARQFK